MSLSRIYSTGYSHFIVFFFFLFYHTFHAIINNSRERARYSTGLCPAHGGAGEGAEGLAIETLLWREG